MNINSETDLGPELLSDSTFVPVVEPVEKKKIKITFTIDCIEINTNEVNKGAIDITDCKKAEEESARLLNWADSTASIKIEGCTGEGGSLDLNKIEPLKQFANDGLSYMYLEKGFISIDTYGLSEFLEAFIKNKDVAEKRTKYLAEVKKIFENAIADKDVSKPFVKEINEQKDILTGAYDVEGVKDLTPTDLENVPGAKFIQLLYGIVHKDKPPSPPTPAPPLLPDKIPNSQKRKSVVITGNGIVADTDTSTGTGTDTGTDTGAGAGKDAILTSPPTPTPEKPSNIPGPSPTSPSPVVNPALAPTPAPAPAPAPAPGPGPNPNPASAVSTGPDMLVTRVLQPTGEPTVINRRASAQGLTIIPRNGPDAGKSRTLPSTFGLGRDLAAQPLSKDQAKINSGTMGHVISQRRASTQGSMPGSMPGGNRTRRYQSKKKRFTRRHNFH
jgi:hypothetical protein